MIEVETVDSVDEILEHSLHDAYEKAPLAPFFINHHGQDLSTGMIEPRDATVF